MSSVYDALQRARGFTRSPVPLRARPQRRPEPPPITLAPGPMATALAPLLGAVRPLLDGTDGIVLQFVAATPGEGASTVAREFAFLAATTGRRRTLLVDADRNDPQAAQAFGCDTRLGLLDCLYDGVDDADVLHPVPGTLLSVACLVGVRGPAVADADMLREIYGGLREYFDLIVIDCPAVSGGRFADLQPEAADGVVLIVQAEKTRPAVISHAKTLVENAGGHLIGAVLNKRTNYIPDFLYRML